MHRTVANIPSKAFAQLKNDIPNRHLQQLGEDKEAQEDEEAVESYLENTQDKENSDSVEQKNNCKLFNSINLNILSYDRQKIIIFFPNFPKSFSRY